MSVPRRPICGQAPNPRTTTSYNATVHLLNADLHSHSNVSDGTLSPQAVATRAKDQGVEV